MAVHRHDGDDGDEDRAVGAKSESPLALSEYNREAAIWVREVRKRMHWSRGQMARALTLRINVYVREGVIYFWERGDRTVPAVVLMALLSIARESGLPEWKWPEVKARTARAENMLIKRLKTMAEERRTTKKSEA